jgi:5-methyltetrahydropteroyltriglutamate--homocysteine methyltransferase
MLNAVPERYRDLKLDGIADYFAMARGYQGTNGDVKALAMKKWFNTNYHYLVPEIEDGTQIRLNGTKALGEFEEAKALGIVTKPVVTGAFTFLKLARFPGEKTAEDFADSVAAAYSELLEKLAAAGVEWVQFDEPILVKDQTPDGLALFKRLYEGILNAKGSVKILLQTYFGDIRDSYQEVTALGFDGVGLDFIEGKESLDLLQKNGFPDDKVLFAGVVNGKNVWRNHYAKTLPLLGEIGKYAKNIVIGTSCSLLHVPFTVESETNLDVSYKKHLAFAVEKLQELADLKKLASSGTPEKEKEYAANAALFQNTRHGGNEAVRAKVASLSPKDFTRLPAFAEREKLQKSSFRLPLLPTTTIGSFPQTADVRANRSAYKKGRISKEEYVAFNKRKIAECIALQEKIGLDVLVHGEFERNDMVEYFGEHLDGFLFTEKAWVQSYGTRCVKPPIIWGDVARRRPITVGYSKYAQSLTKQYVKGMLTGPVTILNWSFPREDIPLKECAFQIALAIREEVLDLEANGIKIIQIDEAALREKLPLRKVDWHKEYLDWAIPAFRLVHSGVKPETQIHTHMCYSEFGDIIKDIDDMDADVITFEASRSDLAILTALNKSGFKTEVGPGVYDIHSPRVPSKEEIVAALHKMLKKIPKEKLWVNPDCGLKTRGTKETVPSLEHLVEAAKEVRGEL